MIIFLFYTANYKSTEIRSKFHQIKNKKKLDSVRIKSILKDALCLSVLQRQSNSLM